MMAEVSARGPLIGSTAGRRLFRSSPVKSAVEVVGAPIRWFSASEMQLRNSAQREPNRFGCRRSLKSRNEAVKSAATPSPCDSLPTSSPATC